jgi:hypothetical protein
MKITIVLAAISAVLSTPSFADDVDINPNNYSSGQDITHAVPGVSLFAMLPQNNPDPNAPIQQQLLPAFYSVFAQTVSPGCMSSDSVGCAPPGTNNVFGYTPTHIVSNDPILWGPGGAALMCLNGCSSASGGDRLYDPALFVAFNTPTDSATVEAAYYHGEGGWITALNSQGQQLGSCYGTPGFGATSGGSPAYQCVNAVTGSDVVNGGWANYTMTDATADISYLVIGSTDFARPVADISFNRQPVPLPSDLSLLGAGVLVVLALRRRQRVSVTRR